MSKDYPKPVENGELRDKLKTYNWSGDRDYQLAVIAFREVLAQEKAKWDTDARFDELNNFPTTLYTPEHEYKLDRLAKLLDKENI